MGIKLSTFISQPIETGSKIVPSSTIQGYSNLLNSTAFAYNLHTLHIPHTPTHYTVIYFFETGLSLCSPDWPGIVNLVFISSTMGLQLCMTTQDTYLLWTQCKSQKNSYILLTGDRDKENSAYIIFNKCISAQLVIEFLDMEQEKLKDAPCHHLWKKYITGTGRSVSCNA